MRYEKTHKESTHRRILEVASRRFRQQGFSGVGVATIMADAGLTHGGFYSHFSSKDALIEEVIAESMDEFFRRMMEAVQDDGLKGFVRYYLREKHRDRPEKGCPVSTFSVEIGSQSEKAREIFTKKYLRMVEHIESLLPEPNRKRALAIYSSLVGALQLSRVVSDAKLAGQILEAGQKAAFRLAKIKPQSEEIPTMAVPPDPSPSENSAAS